MSGRLVWPDGTIYTITRSNADTDGALLEMECALCATANARGLGDLTGPRALLYIAMLVREFPQHSRAAGRALNLAAAPLATLARAVGLRPVHAPRS